MKTNFVSKTLAGAFFAFYAITTSAQSLKVPAPSPSQTIKQAFGLGEITIEYSRPSAKGRVIYGDLVPYGKVWRTGANAATKITFTDDAKLEGKDVKAGTYAIYTIPNKDEWDVMLYKDLTLGGNVAEYKAENEVLRVKVKPTIINQKTETFTFNLADITSNSAAIELIWENTRVALGVKTEIDAKIMKSIEEALSPADKRPYFAAARYYYENDKDMKTALDWANKAVAQNPKAYWVILLKARIQVKLKDFKGAIATAEQSLALAKEDKNDDYVKMNEELIAEAKKGK